MRSIVRIAVLVAAALGSLNACQPAQHAGTQSAGQDAAELSKGDAAFLYRAGTATLQEIAFATLARTKAADPAVRGFADKVIAELTPVNQALGPLTQSKGETPPADMDGTHQELHHQLQSLNGTAFNRFYINGQMQDLTMTIQIFQREADSGTDPQLRSFAQQHLPAMLELLQSVANLHDSSG